jgi:hypothetical protein
MEMQPRIVQQHGTARVYLHPAAATSLIALRAIQHVTGRIATIDATGYKVRLLTTDEQRDTFAAQPLGGV